MCSPQINGEKTDQNQFIRLPVQRSLLALTVGPLDFLAVGPFEVPLVLIAPLGKGLEKPEPSPLLGLPLAGALN